MASFTMTASIFGCPAVTKRSTVPQKRLVVNAVRAVEGEKMVSSDNDKEGSNGRRDLMFAAAAAALCSVAGVAMADDEPRRGTPEAKKKYGPVCVTNPTARICRY
ncbi:hypothetical protein P8452_24701 [Trifolium repens]|nr:hypothetical protein P8452_24701 [Trifolium repens]